MNMYLHEIKSIRKSTIVWICVIIAIAAMYFSMYPSILRDAEDFKRILGSYPAPVRAAIGISVDNITSTLGFYAMIFSFVTLCIAIEAMNLGISVISKESRERTADFLMVKPVSRISIVTAKIMAAITVFLIIDIIYYIAASIIASFVSASPYNSWLFFMINLTLFFIQLIFFAIGLVISVFFTKLKSILPISLGVVFGFFIIGSFIADKNNEIRLISPFKYFDTFYIMKNSGYESIYIVAAAVIFLVSIAVSYVVYVKKDIHAVS